MNEKEALQFANDLRAGAVQANITNLAGRSDVTQVKAMEIWREATENFK